MTKIPLSGLTMFARFSEVLATFFNSKEGRSAHQKIACLAAHLTRDYGADFVGQFDWDSEPDYVGSGFGLDNAFHWELADYLAVAVCYANQLALFGWVELMGQLDYGIAALFFDCENCEPGASGNAQAAAVAFFEVYLWSVIDVGHGLYRAFWAGLCAGVTGDFLKAFDYCIALFCPSVLLRQYGLYHISARNACGLYGIGHCISFAVTK